MVIISPETFNNLNIGMEPEQHGKQCSKDLRKKLKIRVSALKENQNVQNQIYIVIEVNV
jgi:hypothetical protein